MTFIQPHKSQSLQNIIIGILVVVLLMGTFWLVVLYNRVVNLNHDVLADKAQLDAVGAQSTSLSNQELAALGTDQASSIAAADGLVVDGKPQYFTEPASPSALAVQ